MLSTKNKESNYLAKVVRVTNLQPIEGADRIQKAVVDFMESVVSKEVKEGDILVYFVANSAINSDYLSYTNAFRKNLNMNSDLESAGGFFESNGRLKPIKLRGVKSEIYLVNPQSISDWAGVKINWEDYVGTEFDTVKNLEICKKYVIKTKASALSGRTSKKPRLSQLIDGQVHFHTSTENLRKNLDNINPEDYISITSKWHGTSVTAQHVLVKRKLSWLEKVAKFLGAKVQDTEYKLVYTSRKVVKNDDFDDEKKHDHFYEDDVWGHVVKKYQLEEILPKSYCIYGEIVGYVPHTSTHIQKDYDYGVEEGVARMVVYRVTNTNADGVVINLTDNQMREFCERVGLEVVPLFYTGFAKDVYDIPTVDTETWRAEFLAALERDYLEEDCQYCTNPVPAEGIVVRNDGRTFDFEAYKLKSFRFLEMESKQMDNGEANIEDGQ